MRLLRVTLSLIISLPPTLAAQSWSQWRGPSRDGYARDSVLPTEWPKQLTKLRATPIGSGYSSPVVSATHVFVHTREGDEEVVRSLELGSGKLTWINRYRSSRHWMEFDT
jgi:hypothetical protein